MRGKAKVVAALASAPANSSPAGPAGPAKTIFVEQALPAGSGSGGEGGGDEGDEGDTSLVLALFERGRSPGFNNAGVAAAADLCVNAVPVALLFR